ncbi:ABC transporter ATP-binding protein [Pseudoclavibacter sp. Z016]|uniref:ABC transporter ATP-binding protein n=1 Tax=Pseudoclavibacter sp. Z016 TaxID=2080581 RepID=UPI000CE8843C|nr:ABC transporter ATP-binding protein [Pseudoclavibacter sp. Z016]PPF74602.1 ABC transporter [Pseudoclavibacter sp. Z016]
MSTQAAIEVTDLVKRYGDRDVVDGLSFEVRHGETFAFLGPNGAGKSTTIEILEGFRTATSGTARVLEQDPARGNAEWRGRIGVVSQSSADIERYSAREVLRHFASLYRNPRAVDDTIERCGIAPFASQRVGRLSGGQKRRVDVALGIIGNPEVLFLDEPTTGFDPNARREFWGLIQQLKGEGMTMVLTTHYLDEAEQLSDRAGIIAAGKLVEIGDIATIGGPKSRTPRVRWQEQDGRWREETTDAPAQLVGALVERLGPEPAGLTVTRPSLEDVYLEIIGEHPAASPGTPATASPAAELAATDDAARAAAPAGGTR